jgi:hypothetical protein
MSASWWITLVICVASLVYARFEHAEIADEFKISIGRERFKNGLKLFLLWFVPTASLVATLWGAWECVEAEQDANRQARAIMDTSNSLHSATQQLAKLEITMRRKPLKERLVEFLNSREPQLLSSLSNGTTRFNWAASVPDVGILQEFMREPESSNYMELRVLGLRLSGGKGTVRHEQGLDLRLKPELIKDTAGNALRLTSPAVR